MAGFIAGGAPESVVPPSGVAVADPPTPWAPPDPTMSPAPPPVPVGELPPAAVDELSPDDPLTVEDPPPDPAAPVLVIPVVCSGGGRRSGCAQPAMMLALKATLVASPMDMFNGFMIPPD